MSRFYNKLSSLRFISSGVFVVSFSQTLSWRILQTQVTSFYLFHIIFTFLDIQSSSVSPSSSKYTSVPFFSLNELINFFFFQFNSLASYYNNLDDAGLLSPCLSLPPVQTPLLLSEDLCLSFQKVLYVFILFFFVS